MILQRSGWLIAIALVPIFAGFSIAWMDERPVLEVRDGNLFVTSAKDKNITLQTTGASYVNVNGINLLHVASAAQNASILVEQWKLGVLAELENVLSRLMESIEGPFGLQSKVHALEIGLGLNRTMDRPVMGRTSPRPFFNSGTDSIARTRIQRLTARVRQLEVQAVSFRRKLETDECVSNPCRNGGTCEDKIDGYKCLCMEGWEGPQCETDVNECHKFDGTDLGCQNGATCRNTPGSYSCACASGWFGIHCTKRSMDCSNENSNEICGHGVCVNKPGTPLKYACICDQGWEIDSVTSACTKDVDECAGKRPPCSVNPLVPCINVPGTFYCGGCPQGYTGNGYYCTDLDECAINNGGCSTSPSVPCINTMGSRVCGSCPPGYQGDGVTCTYVGSCRINNGGCHPMATCIDSPGMGDYIVQCRCLPGYQGSGMGPNGCQVVGTDIGVQTSCSSNPCIHGACVPNGPSDYRCMCYSRFTGKNCDVELNPCDPNPCRNGGTCMVRNRAAACRCTTSFTGPRCDTPRESCGQTFRDLQGTLQFPTVSRTYQHRLSCAWVWITNSSMVLNITFTAFNLEHSTDCQFDFVQIHDGPTAGEHIIGRYCGNSLPNGGNIISSQEAVYLWFHSDGSVAKDGFTLEWNSIAPVCGGEINADHGSISSPGSPGKYPADRDCSWYVSVTSGKRIQFHFFTMMLEEHPTCDMDYLEIRDGRSTSSNRLGLYCNHTHPPPLVTSGSEAWLHFHSDSAGQDAGFQITFSSIEGIPGCGGVYTASSGTLQTPNFPLNYESNLDCEWKIQIPTGERVKINWISFELESSRGCRFDFVEVYSGPNREAPLVGRYCGDTLPSSILSESNILLIRFKSDWSFSEKGFQLTYEVWCGGQFTEETGVVKSPYYPQPYPASRTCIYEIIQPPGKAISLDIQDMDIEGLGYPDCMFDYLEVHDGDNENSTIIGTYCGSNSSIPEFPIMSTHNYMWLKFTTDRSNHLRGFKAVYTTSDRRCGGLFKTPSGIIQTPTAGSGYGNEEDCNWTIQAPPGFVIQLTWLTFDLEYHPACRNDYIRIYENITRNSRQDMGTYCGTTRPPILTTQTQILSIQFHTDESVTRDGFMASYVFIDASKVCGGHFYSITGSIKTPNYPNHYPENRQCEWIIEAPNRHQVVLNVVKFDLESQSSCSFDSLEIRNGGTATSPLMGKYCGSNIPMQITSFGNQIYLKFTSDVSRAGEGFNIEWDSTTIGCGGTLNTTSGSISSPGYPQPYTRNAECNWKIGVSAGSIIQLIIVDLDLEQHDQCVFDFIEIFEGPTRRGKKLGKYCGTDHPLYVQTTTNVVNVRFRSDYSGSGRGFHINYITLCHNKLRTHRGVIESPNFPNDYPHRENCSWTIEAPMGNKINLTFSHFDLEAGSEESCPYDYLEVKEGDDDQPTREIGKYCDSTVLPPKVVSTQRQVFLQFYSDSYLAHNGFRLEWVVNGCGGFLDKPEGIIMSPGYPQPYPQNIECEWSIEVDYTHSIEITLVDVNLEKIQNCVFDKLEIYSGADNSTPKLLETCHIDKPVTLTSTGNKLFVKFSSDHSYETSGFNATYRSVPIQCGGKFTTATGLIHSANYPSNYPANQNCEWFIQVPVNHVVNLTFVDFDLEDSRNCTDDYVRIYDGPTRDAPILGSHCNNVLPPSYTSTTNELLVVMRTDSYIPAKGFKATYDLACGARIVSNDQGVISMNSAVGLHTEITNCTWTIVAENLEDHVTLTFTHIQILPSNYERTDCDDNSIQVYEGEGTDGPSLGTWCGTKVPPSIVSQGNALTIHASSKYAPLYHAVFSATYSVLNSACGGNYTSEHGTISTPGYPNSYPRNIECIWYIRTSPGNPLSLSFTEFDVIQSENCDLDYVEVREESGIGKLIGTYCGTDVNAINSPKSLWIKFRSTADGTRKGFAAEYNIVHGGDLTGPTGQISSPLYPHPYMLQGEFEWHITVDFKSSILITFEDFHIDRYSDDCYLYLTIYDGYDSEARELMSACGVTLPEPVRSSSNVVYIKFSTDSMRQGSWFLLNWLQVPRTEIGGLDNDGNTGTPCQNTISLINPGDTNYTISSPGWPEGYATHLDCSWILESIPGTHLVLRFNALDLETTEQCLADNVQVFSGNSLSASRSWTQVGDNYCYSNATRTSVETTNLMKVTFHSDVYLNGTGFNATIHKACGGQLQGPNGIIEANETSSNARLPQWTLQCQWNVTVRPGRTIGVKIISLNMQNSDSICGRNYLMLKNGDSASSPILGIGKYCGTAVPNEELVTTGNQLYVKVIGMRSLTQFKLQYREIGMNCGGEILLGPQNKMWQITTPNYPNIPSPHSECSWIVMAPAGEVISIHFPDRFDLTPSQSCTREYLEIRDGGTDISRLLGRYCGSQAPSSVFTTGNVMYLHFYTDIPDPKNGFNATVTIGEQCGGLKRGRQGVIESPNYPNPFPTNVSCTWRIIGPPGHMMKLQFRDIHLPSYRICENTDHVTIGEELRLNGSSDASFQQLGIFCGTTKPELIQSAGNIVEVKFVSDVRSRSNFRGFSLNFTTSPEVCGGSLIGSAGEFSSPGYPNINVRNRYCQWKITVPEGHRVQIDILDLDIGAVDTSVPLPQPFGPRLLFYHDFNYIAHVKDIAPQDTDRQVISTSNRMLVWYWSSTGTRRGFKARYSAISPSLCGATVRDNEGTLLSNQNTVFNMSDFYCEWKVYSPTLNTTHKTLAVTISGFVSRFEGAGGSNRCRYSSNSLTILDSDDLPVVHYCGNRTEPVVIRSPSQVNTVMAVKGTPDVVNFTLTYRWYGCGGILHGPSHTINAPRGSTYPIECAWQAKFPDNGEVITLTFKKLNLGTCATNYILIRNGGASAPQFDKVCGSILPPNIKSQSNQLWIEYHGEDSHNDFEFQLETLQGGCGGFLQQNVGVLTSPGFPNQYPNNAECDWIIAVENGYRVGLVFVDRFNLETSPNCGNDFVRLFDWQLEDHNDPESAVWLEIATVCGRNTPQIFNSTSNRMMVQFRSNNAIQGDGFRAKWDTNCGGILPVTKSTKYLTSPGWPMGYPGRMNCNYTFVAEDKNIIVQFTEFSLERGRDGICRFDNVTIVSSEYGRDTSGSWCGTDRPPTLSVGSRLEIHFKTDSYVERKGFELKYHLDECGDIITRPTDISSPSIDENGDYYARINCTWIVKPPAGKAAVIRFESFHLEYSTQCYFDFVAVYSGTIIQQENRLALLCGSLNGSLPVVKSENGTMTINFVTDRSFNFGGFKAKVLFTSGQAAGCGGEIRLDSHSQPFRTQRGSTYEASEDCHWLVRAPASNTVKLSISNMDLKNSSSPKRANQQCSGDYLEIRDGEGPFSELIATYCGNVSPSPISTSSNTMWIRLVTDGDTNGNGISGTLQAVPSACGESILVVGNDTQVLTSPGFSSTGYDAGMRCRWKLTYPDSVHWKRITIHFLQFDLSDSENCEGDRLYITDKSNRRYISEGFGEELIFSGTRDRPRHTWRNSRMPLGSYYFCGSALPHDYHSGGDEVEMTFTSGPSPQGRHSGFKLEYSISTCNRNYTGAQGRIVHDSTKDCWFTITAPENYTISLYFNEFTLYDGHDCTERALQIRDGDFSASTIAMLCGMTIPDPVFSTGNRLSLRSYSPNAASFESYDITYTTTNKGRGCGGQLFNYEGRFTSPLYPGPYRNASECIWEVSVPASYLVRLDFKFFDLGVRETCETDNLAISDVQPNGDALSSTTYCGGDIPAAYHGSTNKVKVKYATSVNNGGTGWSISFSAQLHHVASSQSSLFAPMSFHVG